MSSNYVQEYATHLQVFVILQTKLMERHVTISTTAQEMTNVLLEFALEMQLSVLLKNNANSRVFVPILLASALLPTKLMELHAIIQICVPHLILVW